MDEFDTERVAEAPPEFDRPVLVEGLPGVGHVGKLAAEHLLEELDTTLVVRLYSEHFPPQVTVEDGRSELACVEFHAVRTDDADLLVLTGDHQAQDNVGHYRLTDRVLDVAAEFGVERVFALGGVPTGELIDEYDVIGAASTAALRDDLGVSGLLLGLGERRGVPAACLMGETSGYLVDPKSARAVLETLGTIVGFEVGYDALEDRAEEMEEVIRKISEMEGGGGGGGAPGDDDLRYIG